MIRISKINLYFIFLELCLFGVCTILLLWLVLIIRDTLNATNPLVQFSELEFSSNTEIYLPFLTIICNFV